MHSYPRGPPYSLHPCDMSRGRGGPSKEQYARPLPAHLKAKPYSSWADPASLHPRAPPPLQVPRPNDFSCSGYPVGPFPSPEHSHFSLTPPVPYNNQVSSVKVGDPNASFNQNLRSGPEPDSFLYLQAKFLRGRISPPTSQCTVDTPATAFEGGATIVATTGTRGLLTPLLTVPPERPQLLNTGTTTRPTLLPTASPQTDTGAPKHTLWLKVSRIYPFTKSNLIQVCAVLIAHPCRAAQSLVAVVKFRQTSRSCSLAPWLH